MPATNAYGFTIQQGADPADGVSAISALASSIGPYTNMRFSSAAARDALLTAPVAGMSAYLTDIDQWVCYDGAAWRPLAPFATALVSVTLTSGVAVGSLTQAFTWPAGRFTQAPMTVITNVGGSGSSSFIAQMNAAATTTGGTILISHKDGGSTSTVTMTVHVMGIQMSGTAAAG